MKQNRWPLVLFMLLLFFGCRDKCERLDCINGECIEGKCACEQGYEGGLCETASNEKFNGIYDLNENCTAGSDGYEVRLEPSSTEPMVFEIFGLWEQEDDAVTVQIAEDGTSFEAGIQMLNNKRVVISATSDAFANTINLDYEVYEPGQTAPFDICQATLERR